MSKKQKLELTWIGKENRPQLESPILVGDPWISYHALHCMIEKKFFNNQMIFGGNLLAPKAVGANSFAQKHYVIC